MGKVAHLAWSIFRHDEISSLPRYLLAGYVCDTPKDDSGPDLFLKRLIGKVDVNGR